MCNTLEMVCCCKPCKCQPQLLQPAILFNVSKRAGGYPAWRKLGYTIDLSQALKYQDSGRGAWISVTRGYVDDNGCVYNSLRERVESLPLHSYCD